MKINWDRVYKGFTALALAAVLVLSALAFFRAQSAAVSEAGVARGGFSTLVHFEQGGGQLTVENGGVISVTSGGTLAVDAGATRTVGGQTESGAVRFGTASNVISGTTIAHGFTTTPTVFLVEPASNPSANAFYSQTLWATGCNVTSCTVGVTAGTVTTFTVQWMAGK